MGTPAYAIVSVLLAACVAAGLHWLVQHFIVGRRPTTEKQNEVAGFIFSVVGVIYAVVLGFVVIVAWEKYDAAVSNTDAEIASIADIYRTVGGFPLPLRTHIRSELRNYIVFVAHTEWPQMATGASPNNVVPRLERVAGNISRFVPKTLEEEDAHREALGQLPSVFDSRRVRVDRSRVSVPPVLWFALAVGGFATLACAFFFDAGDSKAQIAMTGILAGIIAVLFIVIFEFSNPFSGWVRVSADGWEALLNRLPLIR